MQRKLKSLLRRSSSRNRQAEHNPRPVTSDGQRSRTASRLDGDQYATRRNSFQHQRPIAVTNNATASTEEIDPSIANDYRAYLPAISSRDSPRDSRYMSLGGDTRHLTGASEMKHNEDIANRNIDMYGSSSRPSSLTSQKDFGSINRQFDQDYPSESIAHQNSHGRNTSVHSNGYAGSVNSSGSAAKYALGTGVVTEGGLVDSIRPHKESTKKHNYDRKDWPSRVARDDFKNILPKRKPVGSGDNKVSHTRRQSKQESVASSQFDEDALRRVSGLVDLRSAVMDGQQDSDRRNSDVPFGLNGVIDISNTVDVDKSTRVAPAVTHEVVKPHEHEIREERIYREIHNHDVYHRVQPVYHTEFLPPRHFVHDASGNLVEISEDQIPDCTGEYQRWYIGEKESRMREATPHLPRITEPKVVSDIKYMTPEGFERRETTIVHPPELEDMSGYGGPVVPIEFFHDSLPLQRQKKRDSAQPLSSLRELRETLPVNNSSSRTVAPGRNRSAYNY